ncbi:MAG TPA: thiol-disulfide oxidoreductase [Chitinophagaceae bacterium]|nr:thiol-disulfide oxidoreductase [Chitinophagaceae bacterium]
MNVPNTIVVLFDGDCTVCNRAIRFIALRDKKKIFQFAALQSSRGIELLKDFSINPAQLNSLVVKDGKKLFTHSTAVLQIFKNLSGGWKVLYTGILLPRIIRDKLYTYVAERRHTIFKSKVSCEIILPAVEERLLK